MVEIKQSGASDVRHPKSYSSWDGKERQWLYEEDERPRGAGGVLTAECYDCGMPYSAIGDCSIDKEIWVRISPVGNSGGILCPNCMLARLHVLGISDVQATLW